MCTPTSKAHSSQDYMNISCWHEPLALNPGQKCIQSGAYYLMDMVNQQLGSGGVSLFSVHLSTGLQTFLQITFIVNTNLQEFLAQLP